MVPITLERPEKSIKDEESRPVLTPWSEQQRSDLLFLTNLNTTEIISNLLRLSARRKKEILAREKKLQLGSVLIILIKCLYEKKNPQMEWK